MTEQRKTRSPPPRKRKPTTASKIRALAAQLAADAPALTAIEIRDAVARDLGRPRHEVDQALRVRAVRGRPPNDTVRVHVTIPRAVHELARAEAERDGISIEAVLVSAIASGLVPPEQWTELDEHGRVKAIHGGGVSLVQVDPRKRPTTAVKLGATKGEGDGA